MLFLLSLVALALGAATSHQRLALLSFCSTTNIAAVLETWCDIGTDVCTWEGVTCVESSGVQQLQLSSSSLTGTWPSGFDAQMENLALLEVSNVDIAGVISAQFFQRNRASLLNVHLLNTDRLGLDIESVIAQQIDLPELVGLSARVTDTTGSLSPPGGLLNAPQLFVFRFDNSRLSGPFVSSVFALQFGGSNLEQFTVAGNQLTGAVDGSICATEFLQFIDFSGNQITSFPTCWGAIQVLESCKLERNNLCGPAVNLSPCSYDTVPNALIDPCGICGGNGASCLDCNDVVNGTAVVDVCGVCGGSGNTCFDCAGVAAGTSRYDACDVCNGANACADCAGVPSGSATYDICDVCGGNNLACVDCRGSLFGTSRYDACDVCNGDGSTCRDCSGVPAGSSRYDSCDVCNGANDCVDCLGVSGGDAVYDACGVCDGDGQGCGVSDLLDDLSDARGQSTVQKLLIALAIIISLLALCCIAALVCYTRRR
jgi:hypothetical protein